MSKIGKKPIVLPEGVEVSAAPRVLSLKGKQGTLTVAILPYTHVRVEGNQVQVTTEAAHKQARANWGTMAALLKNAIQGVSKGFEKKLSVEGIGFRAQIEGTNIVLNVGFTHPVKYALPQGVKAGVEKNIITISGIDKQLVGEVAAQIRKVKKPEPYKGKGIRYVGEVVRRKAGKKVAGTGTA